MKPELGLGNIASNVVGFVGDNWPGLLAAGALGGAVFLPDTHSATPVPNPEPVVLVPGHNTQVVEAGCITNHSASFLIKATDFQLGQHVNVGIKLDGADRVVTGVEGIGAFTVGPVVIDLGTPRNVEPFVWDSSFDQPPLAERTGSVDFSLCGPPGSTTIPIVPTTELVPTTLPVIGTTAPGTTVPAPPTTAIPGVTTTGAPEVGITTTTLTPEIGTTTTTLAPNLGIPTTTQLPNPGTLPVSYFRLGPPRS